MSHKQSVILCLLACIPLAACSDNNGTQQNPAIAGAPGSAAGTGAAGTPVAGTPSTTAGAPSTTSASAGRSGSAGSTAAGSGSAGKAGSAAGTTGAAGATAGGTAGASGAPSEGGTAGTGAAPGGAFEMCVSSLKEKCAYSDKETGCSSVMTAPIPLTNGQTWGNAEIKLGPYGGYVEWNQGKDFANPVNASESSCDILAASFGEPMSTTTDILDLRGGDLSLYTVFRPACMHDGDKYPVVTWGNGTCGQSGGYAALNITLASHGFVVISANSRFTGGGNNEMLKALDFAKALNEDPKSIYYQKLDLDKIGAMGHSQGGGATATAAMDPRVKSVIIWNAGLSAVKPFLTVSGERDITGFTPQSMASGVNAAAQPGAWLFYHKILETGGNVTGHLTLMEQPERVVEPTIAWWKYQLNGDAEAKKMFVGTDCGLCNSKDDFEYGAHNLQ
jgi:pimeloyl-ACP methyl ester carboxylesterase